MPQTLICDRRNTLISTHTMRYVPILSTKKGELEALSRMNGQTFARAVPLLEAKGPVWDFENGKYKRSLSEHLSKLESELSATLSGTSVFLDGRELGDELINETVHPLKYVIDSMRAKGCYVVPVVSIESTAVYRSAVRECASDAREICIRIPVQQFKDVDRSIVELEGLVREMGSFPGATHLVFDCGLYSESNGERVLEEILPAVANAHKWASLVFAASSMPRRMPKTDGVHVVDRPEFRFYVERILGDRRIGDIVVFGDYAVESPEPAATVDPRFMNPANNFRYLAGNKWLIARGGKLRPDGSGPLIPVMRELSARPEFEVGFSECESWIQAVVGDPNRKKAGNSKMWRRFGTLRHVEKTVEILSEIAPPLAQVVPAEPVLTA
ncbi:MAG: hypothetical protein Q3999_07915 [Buchananella hordeovulneris]|nr:hypothetical protein [Buchananella hordeovulneris]